MTKSKQEVIKKSLLVGALTSSFGVFISKLLGLLYYSPLNALAGEENMVFYSFAYQAYDMLLKISESGIPFAIAALVAKYVAKDDYKTALLVRKLGMSIVLGLSFVCALVFVVLSGPIARKQMGVLASVSDVQTLKNLYLILLVAVILAPFLSTVRSYYQGLKRLDLYASSQVLEQFVRVFTILVGGYLCIKVLKLNNIYAIYAAIAAASIAALVAIVFFKFTTKSEDKRFYSLVNSQKSEALKSKEVFKELLSLGLPYLMISIFGTATPIINSFFFIDTATAAGMAQAEAELSFGIITANCSKLLAIPQVLTAGFSTGLVPYLTESFEENDYKKLEKQITQIIDTVLFILIPVLAIFAIFSKDIYSIMYGAKNIELGGKLFRISCLYGFTETVLPILSSVLITLRLKKESIFTLIGVAVVKFSTFFILVKLLWTSGMAISTFIASMSAIIVYLVILNRKFDVNFSKSLKRAIVIIVAAAIMVLPALLIHTVLPVDYSSRIFTLLIMALLGIIMLFVYYFISCKFKLIQIIFGIKDPSIKGLLNQLKI